MLFGEDFILEASNMVSEGRDPQQCYKRDRTNENEANKGIMTSSFLDWNILNIQEISFRAKSTLLLIRLLELKKHCRQLLLSP